MKPSIYNQSNYLWKYLITNMILYALSVFSITAFGLSTAGESTLPTTTCKRDSANNSVCLKCAIKEAWPLVADPFNVTADDLRGTCNFTGHVINDTWIVEHVHFAPSIEKLKIYFDDLIESKELNDLAVTFVNEYWPLLYRVTLPVSSNILDPWLTGISNSFFSKVSFSKIFP